VHSMMVPGALTRGADRVLIVGCPPGSCSSRYGPQTTRKRLLEEKKPGLDPSKFEPNRLRILNLDATRTDELARAAASYRRETPGAPPPQDRSPGRFRSWAGGAALCAVLCGLTWLGSDLPYRTPAAATSVLVISFKHFGQVSQVTRELSPEELEALPIHMRQKTQVSDRRRADVRLRVVVDGEEVLSRAFSPGGLWGDKNATALETLELTPGPHRIDVAIGDSHDADEWTREAHHDLDVKKGEQRVLLFDATHGFRWY
jgi:hypothetical protein